MLKISIIDEPRHRRLIAEGKLVPPWTVEFTTACEAAKAGLHGRQLIVDLRSLTAISPEAESVLQQLMNESTEFQCGLFMKEVLRQLSRKQQRMSLHAADERSDGDQES